MTKTDRARVKQLYEQVSKHHLNSGVYGWNVDAANRFDHEFYRQVLQGVREPADRRFEADSPWQAALFLIDRQARQGFVPTDPIEFGTQIKTPNFKLIFRGQKMEYDDNIQPYEWRHQQSPPARQKIAPERLHNWQGAFCLLVKSVIDPNLGFSLQNSMNFGAAQHYDIPTDLLDWTVDPCVAIWFTHLRMKNDGTEYGVVFFTDLEGQEKSEIILPPPYVQRLYRQRGIFNFTESREANQQLYESCSRIYYKLDAGFSLPQAFPVRSALMLQPEPLMTEAVQQARSIALDGGIGDNYFDFLRDLTLDATQVDNAVAEAVTRFGSQIEQLRLRFPMTERQSNKIKGQWLAHVESYLGWFSMFDTPSRQKLSADQTILRMIERNRDGLFLYANSLIAAGAARHLGLRGQFIAALRNALVKRYPELESRERHYRTNVRIVNGEVQIII